MHADLAWLKNEFAENPSCQTFYPGKYVAVRHKKIIAVGETYRLTCISALDALEVEHHISDLFLDVPICVRDQEA